MRTTNTSAITFEGERDGQSIYEITSTPRPDAAVVWGKVVTVIEQQTLAPLHALYAWRAARSRARRSARVLNHPLQRQ